MKAKELLQLIEAARRDAAQQPTLFGKLMKRTDHAYSWSVKNHSEIPSERWLIANPDTDMSEFAKQHPVKPQLTE